MPQKRSGRNPTATATSGSSFGSRTFAEVLSEGGVALSDARGLSRVTLSPWDGHKDSEAEDRPCRVWPEWGAGADRRMPDPSRSIPHEPGLPTVPGPLRCPPRQPCRCRSWEADSSCRPLCGRGRPRVSATLSITVHHCPRVRPVKPFTSPALSGCHTSDGNFCRQQKAYPWPWQGLTRKEKWAVVSCPASVRPASGDNH